LPSPEPDWFGTVDRFIDMLHETGLDDWAKRFERCRADPYMVRQGLTNGPLTFWDQPLTPEVERLGSLLIELSKTIDPTSY
jgi:hypothetical protein